MQPKAYKHQTEENNAITPNDIDLCIPRTQLISFFVGLNGTILWVFQNMGAPFRFQVIIWWFV